MPKFVAHTRKKLFTFTPLRDSKGQVSAPFELFVAIIIMAFVILIGSQMLKKANDEVCLNSVDKSLAEFKSNLEAAANSRSSSKFDFYPQVCFDKQKAKIKIEKITEAKTCSLKCGSPKSSCFVLSFQALDITNGYKEKCLALPIYTSFYGGTADADATLCATSDDSLLGYVSIDPTAGINIGSYVIRDVASAAEQYPRICTFLKK